jgi:hypothetical protein
MRATLQKIINYAVKAPSGHNTQPWKFRAEGCSLYIYPDYTRSLQKVDGDHHELFISLGCALENAVVAANAFGYKETVSYHFNGDQDYIRVSLEPTERTKDLNLFLAIDERQVTRSVYNKQNIPATQLVDMVIAARERDVFLNIYDTEEEIAGLVPFVEEAAVLQYGDKDFRRELAEWVRFNDEEAAEQKDGLRSRLLQAPEVPTWMGKLYMNHFVSAEGEAKKARELVESSSALVLFTALNNNKEGWVNLGRCYERMALMATALGIRHAHVNMPCEERAVREKLKRSLGYVTEEPLLLIRLGYAEAAPRSYRRRLEEVMEA